MNIKKLYTLLFASLLALPAFATIMIQLGLQDLATGAEHIVQAQVTAIIPRWEENNTVINTYIRMNILDDLFGDDEDNEIIVKIPGGEIGGLHLEAAGVPKYKVGEENILFLFRDPNNGTVFQTLGLYQGKYRIFLDENNIQRVAQEAAAEGVSLFKRSGLEVPAQTGTPYTLEEFKQLVRECRNNPELR